MPAILGHDRPLALLRAAMRRGKMHHAWVFHGPEGVGKRTVALHVAQTLLCHAPAQDKNGDPTPCGGCDSCRLMLRPDSAHPDFHFIHKELAGVSGFSSLRGKKQMNIPLDLLRERMVGGYVDDKYVEPVIARKPMLSHGKVFVIDEADLLDTHGQNTLLKTLEEPPPNTYIFLVTSQEQELLPTIRSRCQRIAFGPLDDKTVAAWVKERSGEAPGPWLMRFARGSLGRAALAMEYRLDKWAETVEASAERLVGGKPDTQFGPAMASLVDEFAEAWVKNHKGASKDAANKAGVRHMFGLVGEVCRRKLRDTASNATPDAAAPWVAGIDLLQEAELNLETNVSVALLLDNLAIQWSVMNSPHPVG